MYIYIYTYKILQRYTYIYILYIVVIMIDHYHDMYSHFHPIFGQSPCVKLCETNLWASANQNPAWPNLSAPVLEWTKDTPGWFSTDQIFCVMFRPTHKSWKIWNLSFPMWNIRKARAVHPHTGPGFGHHSPPSPNPQLFATHWCSLREGAVSHILLCRICREIR